MPSIDYQNLGSFMEQVFILFGDAFNNAAKKSKKSDPIS